MTQEPSVEPHPSLVMRANGALTLFDAAASRAAHDAAIATVEAHTAPLWAELAYRAVERVAALGRPFIVDAAVEELERTVGPIIARPAEGRAWGAVMQRAMRAGIITPTGRFRNSANARHHANPRREWEARAVL